MTNDLIRGDVNWCDRRCSQRRSAGVAGRRSRVAAAQDERRRSITLGSMMTFARLAAQPNPRWSCRPKTQDFSLAPRAASLDRCRSRIRLGLAVYSRMPYLKREVSGLQCGAGQCKNCRLFQCLCVFWRSVPAEHWPPAQSSLHPIPPLRESDPYRLHLRRS